MLTQFVTDWTLSISNVIQWAVLIATAIAIYLGFQRHQVRIARHSVVRQIEEDIAALFRSKMARVEVSGNGVVKLEEREFRAVLDNQPPWTFEEDQSAPAVSGCFQSKFQFIDGQRYWQIRSIPQSDGTVLRQYLSSQAFQDTLLWFRRVNRARKDRVITPDELLDLWRAILPLGFAGRANYLAHYFQGGDDIIAMVQVINETLRSGLKQNHRRPLHYFCSYVTEQDRAVLARDKKADRLHSLVAKAGK